MSKVIKCVNNVLKNNLKKQLYLTSKDKEELAKVTTDLKSNNGKKEENNISVNTESLESYYEFDSPVKIKSKPNYYQKRSHFDKHSHRNHQSSFRQRPNISQHLGGLEYFEKLVETKRYDESLRDVPRKVYDSSLDQDSKTIEGNDRLHHVSEDMRSLSAIEELKSKSSVEEVIPESFMPRSSDEGISPKLLMSRSSSEDVKLESFTDISDVELKLMAYIEDFASVYPDRGTNSLLHKSRSITDLKLERLSSNSDKKMPNEDITSESLMSRSSDEKITSESLMLRSSDEEIISESLMSRSSDEEIISDPLMSRLSDEEIGVNSVCLYAGEHVMSQVRDKEKIVSSPMVDVTQECVNDIQIKGKEDIISESLMSRSSSEDITSDPLMSRSSDEEITSASLMSRSSDEEITSESLMSRSSDKDIMSESMMSRLIDEKMAPESLMSRPSVEEIASESLMARSSDEEMAPETLMSRSSDEEITSESLMARSSDEEITSESLMSRSSDKDIMYESLMSRSSDEKMAPESLISKSSDEEMAPETLMSRPSVEEIASESLMARSSDEEMAPETLMSRPSVEEIASESLMARSSDEEMAPETLMSRSSDEEIASESLMARSSDGKEDVDQDNLSKQRDNEESLSVKEVVMSINGSKEKEENLHVGEIVCGTEIVETNSIPAPSCMSSSLNNSETLQEVVDEEVDGIEHPLQKKDIPLPKSYSLATYVDKSELLTNLVKLGVDLSRIEKNINAANMIIKLDYKRDVEPRLFFLRDIGVTDDNLGIIITKNPFFLTESIENLQAKVNYFTSKKFSPDDTARIITIVPAVLYMAVKNVDAKLGFYQKQFKLTGPEVRHLVNLYPKSLVLNILDVKDKYSHFIEFLGFTDVEMKKMLLTYPRMFMRSKAKLSQKFDFMHNVMGLSHKTITEFPIIFGTRLFIFPQRHKYLVSLGRAQYDPTVENYVSPLKLVEGRNDEFCKNVAKTSLEEFEQFMKTL